MSTLEQPTGSGTDSKTPAKTCENCHTGHEHQGTPKGSIGDEEIGGLKYYFAKGSSEGGKAKAIVLITDIFGISIANGKLLADRFAEETGYDVYAPDYYKGDPAPIDKVVLVSSPQGNASVITKAKNIGATLISFFRYVGVSWYVRNRPGVVTARVKDFIVALKKEKSIEKIGAVGYCMGGLITCVLGGDASKPIDVAIIAHPGPLKVDDFKRLDLPTALVCAEEDDFFDSIKDKVVPVVEAMQKPHEVVTYPGTVHGFAIRGDWNEPATKKAYDDAAKQTTSFFKAHL